LAALASAPVAHASEGSDYTEPWLGPFHYVNYQADPGEANNVLVEPWNFGEGLHLKDTGAIIRWMFVPERSRCFGGGRDVWCADGRDALFVIFLGDGRDTFVNRSAAPAWVDARDGEADRITCGAAQHDDDVVADALDVIVNPGACNTVERG
jgi:hypothetical protein